MFVFGSLKADEKTKRQTTNTKQRKRRNKIKRTYWITIDLWVFSDTARSHSNLLASVFKKMML